MTKSKWRATGLLLAAFVLGALSGGAAIAMADRAAPSKRDQPRSMVERLAQELDLSAEQRDSISAILERHHAEFHAIRQEIGEEMRVILRPEQLTKYEAIKDSMRRRFKRSDPGRENNR